MQLARGDYASATATLDLLAHPSSTDLQYSISLLMPVVYNSADDVSATRARLGFELGNLTQVRFGCMGRL